MASEGQNGLQVFNASGDGIIAYSTDGYENITLSDLTEDILNKKGYESSSVKDNTQVKKGDAIYKLIQDNKWNIVILLSDESAKDMSEMTSVKVRFSKDNETAVAGFSVQKINGMNVGVLSFSNSMVRYVQERYLDMELILQDVSGLKIPKSAVTEKDFYLVPQDYLTQGGNSNNTGVLIDNGDKNAEFQSVEVYYRDEENGTVYLDPNDFKKNTSL